MLSPWVFSSNQNTSLFLVILKQAGSNCTIVISGSDIGLNQVLLLYLVEISELY